MVEGFLLNEMIDEYRLQESLAKIYTPDALIESIAGASEHLTSGNSKQILLQHILLSWV